MPLLAWLRRFFRLTSVDLDEAQRTRQVIGETVRAGDPVHNLPAYLIIAWLLLFVCAVLPPPLLLYYSPSNTWIAPVLALLVPSPLVSLIVWFRWRSSLYVNLTGPELEEFKKVYEFSIWVVVGSAFPWGIVTAFITYGLIHAHFIRRGIEYDKTILAPISIDILFVFLILQTCILYRVLRYTHSNIRPAILLPAITFSLLVVELQFAAKVIEDVPGIDDATAQATEIAESAVGATGSEVRATTSATASPARKRAPFSMDSVGASPRKSDYKISSSAAVQLTLGAHAVIVEGGPYSLEEVHERVNFLGNTLPEIGETIRRETVPTSVGGGSGASAQ
ncbi:hypothetical protein JCM8097_003100 [Rhodosporidiobolus ruineniae]